MISADIFYVEDDKDFAFILEHAVKEVRDDLTLNVVEDGVLAIQQLEQFVQSKRKPKLILLDLNLPGMSGLDVLRRVKETAFLRYVPVILFSTSDNPNDIKSSYEMGANAFVSKPNGYTELVDCVKSLYDFWFTKSRSIN